MKGRYGRLSLVLATGFLALLSISVAALSFRAQGTSDFGNPKKNPKLSSALLLLSRSAKQSDVRPPVPEAVTSPKGFSIEGLPKPLRDAVRSHQMRITDSGKVQVYIEVNSLSSPNLDQLRSLGVTIQIIGRLKPDKALGEVKTTTPTVEGLLPVTMISQVSALPFVRYIRLPDYGLTNIGSVDSQGDQILQAAQARSQFGVDGTGIRVGVISNGIGGIFDPAVCSLSSEIPNPIQTGDLPKTTPICANGILTGTSGGITARSFRGDGDLAPPSLDTASGEAAEGTAMLEIVHDLAPGAQLLFANSDTSMSFEQAVDYIAANADVGVDDINFPTPPFDGTSDVSTNTAAALNADANPVRAYFTAVGNFAQDHYEGPYADSGRDGTAITGQPGDLHEFQAVSGSTVDNGNFGSSIFDPATVPAGGVIDVFLSWNDSSAGSSNDYDLFLVPLSCKGFSKTTLLPLPPCVISGAPLTSSMNPQTGTQPPGEELSYSNPSSSTPVAVGIVIQNVNNAAAMRTFDMFVLGALGDEAIPDHNFNTVQGSVAAEADAGGSPVSVISVGAIDQTQCSDADNCARSVEPYSSQGLTEATPQAAARMKPDIVATDDVAVTGAGGFGFNAPNGSATGGCAFAETPCYFPGTSAASPHAAAIAALVLQTLSGSSAGESPATARANLRNYLTSTAVGLSAVPESAPNNIEGYGVVDALAAVRAAAESLPAGFSLSSPTPATVSIATGQSATSTVTVIAKSGFAGTVNLSCSVSPLLTNSPLSCSVVPFAVTLNSATTSATATVQIATVAGLSSSVRSGNPLNRLPWFAACAGVMFACIFLASLSRPKRRTAFLTFLGLVFLGATFGGCASKFRGGSSQISLGTPAGNYVATMIATSRGAAQATTISVTVQ